MKIFNHIFYQDRQNSADSKSLMISKINEFCTKEEAELIYDFINDFEIFTKALKDEEVTFTEIEFKDNYLNKKAQNLVDLLQSNLLDSNTN